MLGSRRGRGAVSVRGGRRPSGRHQQGPSTWSSASSRTACRAAPPAGEAAEDFNKDVYIPIRTCRVRFGERIIIRQGGSRTGEQVELHQITLTITDIDKVRSTGDVVVDLLERYHTKKDWEVAVPLDRLKEAEDAPRSLHACCWW